MGTCETATQKAIEFTLHVDEIYTSFVLFQGKGKKGTGKAEAFVSNSSFRIPLCIHNCAKISILKYSILITSYKYKKQFLLTKVPTKRKKGGYLVLYNISALFLSTKMTCFCLLCTHSLPLCH